MGSWGVYNINNLGNEEKVLNLIISLEFNIKLQFEHTVFQIFRLRRCYVQKSFVKAFFRSL